MTLKDLYWAAGFLEGEGCFSKPTKASRSACISAVQVQREPLERLLALFGGSLYPIKRKAKYKQAYRWNILGQPAAELAMILYTLMSPRRKLAIEDLLLGWKAQLLPTRLRQTCRHGHAYTPENTYRSYGKHPRRHCRTCLRVAQSKYRSKAA